jgi:hypothetical protein
MNIGLNGSQIKGLPGAPIYLWSALLWTGEVVTVGEMKSPYGLRKSFGRLPLRLLERN